MAKAQAFIKVQSFILIVVCTWLWGFRGFVLATISAYLVGLLPLLKQVGLKYLSSAFARGGDIPKLFSDIALFSVLSNGISLIGRNADIFVLDHFVKDRTEIGYYSFATILILGATQVTQTVQAIATPYFSEHADDEVWFRHQLVINQIRMAALSALVAVVLFGTASVLVPLFYGSAYRPTLGYLSILLIRYVIWSSYAILGVAVVGLGMMRLSFIGLIVSTSINLCVTYVLLERYGIVGVAWAQTICAGIHFLIGMIVIQLALRQAFGRKVKGSTERTPEDTL
jgi:O-antigen/teichoic acid export membrane protein